MPFEDLTGNSGFTSDSDGAEANLDINMSEDSARNLWDVQAAIQQIATDFQTAVRAAADFNSYLISIRETSQTVRMPDMGSMGGGEGGNMSYSGGRVDAPNLGGALQSEMGMSNRIGEMEENASGAGGGAMSARGSGGHFDPGEAVGQLTNVAWMASMAGHRPIPQETTSAYEQQYQFGLRNMRSSAVLGAQYGGQTGTARAFAASQIVAQGLPAAQQFLRGAGGGGIASMLGRLGAYGAIGYAGYQLVDAGLETYAQSRALAISSNNSQNGVGWGFDQRINQAAMALSPFISQEEASQIYGSAVDQGWASRRGGFAQGDFGQAVNFMYGAAKDYNMDPAHSAQLLQTNALGAGQSIEALAEQLATLKKSVDGTGVSMSVASGVFTDFSSFLIGAGASPSDAARISGGAIISQSGNTFLGPSGAGVRMDLAAMQNSTVQAVVGGLTGNLPMAAFAGGNTDKGIATYENLIHSLAVQYSSQTGMSLANRSALFATAYQGLTGQQLTEKEAESKMAEAAANPHWFTSGQQQYKNASTMTFQHQNSLQSWYHGLDDMSNIGAIAGNSRVGAASLSENEKNAARVNTYNYFSPQVNTLLNNAGENLSNVVLYGPDGKPVMMDGNRVAGANIAKWFNDQKNDATFNDPKSGYYIKDQAGTKYHSYDIGTGGDVGGASSGGAGSSSGNNTVYITLSSDAKKWFDTNTDKLNLTDAKN